MSEPALTQRRLAVAMPVLAGFAPSCPAGAVMRLDDRESYAIWDAEEYLGYPRSRLLGYLQCEWLVAYTAYLLAAVKARMTGDAAAEAGGVVLTTRFPAPRSRVHPALAVGLVFGAGALLHALGGR